MLPPPVTDTRNTTSHSTTTGFQSLELAIIGSTVTRHDYYTQPDTKIEIGIPATAAARQLKRELTEWIARNRDLVGQDPDKTTLTWHPDLSTGERNLIPIAEHVLSRNAAINHSGPFLVTRDINPMGLSHGVMLMADKTPMIEQDDEAKWSVACEPWLPYLGNLRTITHASRNRETGAITAGMILTISGKTYQFLIVVEGYRIVVHSSSS